MSRFGEEDLSGGESYDSEEDSDSGGGAVGHKHDWSVEKRMARGKGKRRWLTGRPRLEGYVGTQWAKARVRGLRGEQLSWRLG